MCALLTPTPPLQTTKNYNNDWVLTAAHRMKFSQRNFSAPLSTAVLEDLLQRTISNGWGAAAEEEEIIQTIAEVPCPSKTSFHPRYLCPIFGIISFLLPLFKKFKKMYKLTFVFRNIVIQNYFQHRFTVDFPCNSGAAILHTITWEGQILSPTSP